MGVPACPRLIRSPRHRRVFSDASPSSALSSPSLLTSQRFPVGLGSPAPFPGPPLRPALPVRAVPCPQPSHGLSPPGRHLTPAPPPGRAPASSPSCHDAAPAPDGAVGSATCSTHCRHTHIHVALWASPLDCLVPEGRHTPVLSAICLDARCGLGCRQLTQIWPLCETVGQGEGPSEQRGTQVHAVLVPRVIKSLWAVRRAHKHTEQQLPSCPCLSGSTSVGRGY